MTRPRRALHRAFAEWLDEKRQRFAVPLRPGRRTDRVWSFSFDGITPAISGWINTFEITVAVELDDHAWDLILDLDAVPKRAPGGFVCGRCQADQRVLFQTRQALWADHLFEPFLLWVNDTLAPSPWLELIGTGDSSTTARLKREPVNDKIRDCAALPVRYVPVRVAAPVHLAEASAPRGAGPGLPGPAA